MTKSERFIVRAVTRAVLIKGKIQRENDVIEASMRMRQESSNQSVRQALDTTIREGQKNLSYLQDSLNKLQITQSGRPPSPPPKGLKEPYQPSIPRSRNHSKLGMTNPRSLIDIRFNKI